MKNSGTLKHLRNLKPRSVTHRASRVSDLAWSTDSRFVAIAGSTKDQQEVVYRIIKRRVLSVSESNCLRPHHSEDSHPNY